MNGIRTFDDLRDRSVIDDATGCWLYAGAKSIHGRPVLWHSNLQKTVSLGTFIALVKTGARPPRGMELRPTCGVAACCNPAHQKLGPKARPRAALSPVHRARITKAHRDRSTRCNAEIAAEIRASEETGLVLAERYTMSSQMVSLIRRHEAWAPVSPWSMP